MDELEIEQARMTEDEALDPAYQDAVCCDSCQEYFTQALVEGDCPDCGGKLLEVDKESE